MEGQRGTAFDLDGLGIINGEDFVADGVLTIEEEMRCGRGDSYYSGN